MVANGSAAGPTEAAGRAAPTVRLFSASVGNSPFNSDIYPTLLTDVFGIARDISVIHLILWITFLPYLDVGRLIERRQKMETSGDMLIASSLWHEWLRLRLSMVTVAGLA